MRITGKTAKNLWVLVRPAEDIPGQWVGHCLDLDIVSVGTSVQHALTMILEATTLVVVDDLEAGRNPFDRHKAPPEYWEAMSQIVREGVYGPLGNLTAAGSAVTQIRISLKQLDDQAAPRAEMLPPAWMLTKLGASSDTRAFS